MITTDYGIFGELIKGNPITVKTSDINIETIYDYQKQLCDLFSDYIENEVFESTKVTFEFDNGMKVNLTPSYALLNIIMWGLVVKTKQTIKPYHVFFNPRGITGKYIKEYIDKYAILPTRARMETEHDQMIICDLNKTIYESLKGLKFVEKFAWFFNNSINNEDNIMMYLNCPGFKEIIDRNQTDYYSQFGPDKMNEIALQDMNKLIEYIIDSKKYIGRSHCLEDTFRAGVGIKPKQAREMFVNIGIKPNGEGGLFPYEINTSYMAGGANNIIYHMAESLTSRIAQILSKKNTAKSGAFARLLNLNCVDTKKYTIPGTDKLDPSFDCCTRNYVHYNVKDEHALYKIADRYYRMVPNGVEYRVSDVYNINNNIDLIGKTILLRSPITCRSAAEGKGICRKCLGELYNIITPTNIGIYSATRVSKDITQMMLSAKHLLEAKILKAVLQELDDYDIDRFVYIDNGSVFLRSDIPNQHEWQVVICLDDINEEIISSMGVDEEDEDTIEDVMNFINVFHIVNTKTGDMLDIRTKDNDNLYLTEWLSQYIADNFKEDEDIVIPVNNIIDENVNLFNIGIQNDDMNARLDAITKIIDLRANVDTYNKETFLETLSERLNSIGLDYIMSVHLEVIISNQIRSSKDILENVDWSIPNNEDYQVLTLSKALSTHPSIAITLQSKNIAKILYNPLTRKKHKASSYDLIYHLQPQNYVKYNPVEEDTDSVFKFNG